MEFAFDGTDTAAEWERWYGRNIEVSEGSIRVARERTPAYVSPRPVIENPPTPFTPVDLDVDECGDLYVLTADAEIYRYDHRKGTLRRLPCLWYSDDDTDDAGEEGSLEPVALAVTEDSIYVADGALGGVAAFSKHRYQLRWIARSVDDKPFKEPLALVGGRRTGFLLDGGPGEREGFVARVTVTGIDEKRAVDGLQAPSDLALGGDGDLYVLDWNPGESDGSASDEDPSYVVRRFSSLGPDDGSFDELKNDEVRVPLGFDPRCIEVVTERQVIVGVGTETSGEWTPYRYLPTAGDDEEGRFERITSFKRTCSTLLLRRQGTSSLGRGLYAIAGPEQGAVEEGEGIYFLDEVARNRLDAGTDDYDARAWRRLDSGTAGTEWHRVETVLSLGDVGTQVRLNYHATDTSDVGDLERDLGIGPVYADRLREAKITGAWAVLEHLPETLSKLASDPEVMAATWINDAWQLVEESVDRDIGTIEGIGDTFSDRLRSAGVTSIIDLLKLDTEEITEIVDLPPNFADSPESWLSEARNLVNKAIGEDWADALGLDPGAVAELHDAGVEEISDLIGYGPPASETVEWIDRAETYVKQEWSRRGSVLSLRNPRDALLTGAEGRYLWIELRLVGSEVSSPLVESFRAYFPRQSYLRYLPAIYQEDERSAAFLERFLSVFESTFVGIEEDLESVTRYLDAVGIPEENIPWLGEWLGIETDETWPEPAQRELIDRAPELFRKRGTREGLIETLEVYLRDSIAVPAAWETALERERGWIEALVNGGELTAAEAAEKLARVGRFLYVLEYSDLDCIDREAARVAYVAGISCPQCFLVLAPPFLDEEAMRAIDRIVDSLTPAHAVGRAVELQPQIQLAGASHPGNTYLGVNSALTEREFLVNESILGSDSVLKEREEFSQLELKSKLGTDTVIS